MTERSIWKERCCWAIGVFAEENERFNEEIYVLSEWKQTLAESVKLCYQSPEMNPL